MKKLQTEDAAREVMRLLAGTTLDTFRVFSTVLLIGFYRFSHAAEIPGEVWISCSGKITINDMPGNAAVQIYNEKDFFSQRVFVLGKLFELLGSSVTNAAISSLGVLSVEVEGKRILFEPDDENLEEIWAVMTDSPDASEDHRWYIALDDSGTVGGHFDLDENS